jgi:hypothetical protein
MFCYDVSFSHEEIVAAMIQYSDYLKNTRETKVTDQDIEKEIQAKGLTAPRVTPESIAAVIASEHYFTAAQGANRATEDEAFAANNRSLRVNLSAREAPAPLHLLTFCALVLKNGFTVTGESACASPENFDAQLGRKIARQHAVNKVWQLEGYLLRQRLADEADSLRELNSDGRI